MGFSLVFASWIAFGGSKGLMPARYIHFPNVPNKDYSSPDMQEL
jgi:hypothetical protein